MMKTPLIRYVLACGMALAGQHSLIAQQETSPGAGTNFTLSPNDLGALQNSVNLYTGQVSFPMTIASLPGRGGLSPRITINYSSSGVKSMMETWNREKPTGILGLGWSFDFPRVVANHNNTATRHDDTFYLVEGGQSVRLICLEHSDAGVSEYRPYATETHQPWRVRYYYATEKWEITKDDGIRYIYGDNTRPKADGTVQNMIAWGNWIGSSVVREGQTELAYVWNLSEIQNFWDDKITYYYENIEEDVGTDTNPGDSFNPKHTKASVLSKIVGPTGNYLQLTYAMKTYEPCVPATDFRCTDKTREYQDPHVEATEPDAYQEKYEPRYLQSLAAYDHRGLSLYDVNLAYDVIGGGEYVKRILTSIEQINYTGARLPKTTFEYDMAETETKGYLIKVKNSIGGHISYQYRNTTIIRGFECPPFTICATLKKSDLAIKEFKAESIGSEWAEPNIYMGPDYAVVIWRHVNSGNPAQAYLQIYQWQGEWKQYDMGYIGLVRLSEDINKHELVVALEQNHFGIVRRHSDNTYRVFLYRKNKFDGGWDSYTNDATLTDGHIGKAKYVSELFFTAGQHHFALGNVGTDKLYTYTWRNGLWQKATLQHSTPSGYAFTGSTHYLIAHNTKPRPNHFWLHHLTEDKKWATKNFAPGFTADGIDSGENDDRTFWYSTPAFTFTMADDNPEFVYQLGEDYVNHNRNTLASLPDWYPVTTPSTSNINISAYEAGKFESNNNMIFFRYNGKEWTGMNIPTTAFLRTKLYHPAQDIIGYSYGRSSIGLMRYDANLGNWEDTNFTTPVDWLDRYVKVSPRSALMGKELHHLEPDGSWLKIGEINTSGLIHDSWYFDLKSSNNLYAVSKPFNRTRFYRILSGQVEERSLSRNMDVRTKHYDVGLRLLGNDIMAAFSTDYPEKYNARSFYLYKWQNDDFRGGHETIVVENVHVNDGNLDISKTYGYDFKTARIDVTGHTPLFNEVTVVTGSSSLANHPKGYTKHYFHNGKPLADLPNIPVGQTDDDVLLFAGSHYRTEMYDAADNLVSSSEAVYSTFKQDVLNTTGLAIDQSYFVRPTRTVSKDYLTPGTQTVLTITAYNEHGYPTEVNNYSHQSAPSAQATNTVRYTYFPEAYDATQHNIYSEVINTVTIANGEHISAGATVWDVISGRPQGVKTYTWRGFGSTAFTAWDGSSPAGQWRLSNQIVQRDSKGNILESADYMEDHESAVYDDLQLNPVLSASYAAQDQVAGTSFEDGQPGKMSFSTTSDLEAYTGSRSLHNGSAGTQSLPNGAYNVYAWYKGGAPTVTITDGAVSVEGDQRTAKSWTLRKWKVLGSGIITVSTTGYVDELRVHPEEAYVTTFVYDDRQRKIAETGPDMITTFYYYDDYHRQHYITDHEGHIVLYYEYGFKKEGE